VSGPQPTGDAVSAAHAVRLPNGGTPLLPGLFPPGPLDLDGTTRRVVLILVTVFVTVGALAYLVISRDDRLVGPLVAALAGALIVGLIPWHGLPKDAFGSVGVAIGAWITWVADLTGGPASAVTPLWFLALAAVGLPLSRRTGTALGLAVAVAALLPLVYRPSTPDDRAHLFVLCGVLVAGAVFAPWTMDRIRRLVAVAGGAESRIADERESAMELRRAMDARYEYLSVVAHELRNPLNGIGAAARVVAKDVAGRASESMVLGIATEARHALELLDGLTDVASLESGRMSFALRPIDIALLLADTVRGMHVEEHAVRLRGTDDPMRVMADEARIGQVIRNLVSNAAKYSSDGSEIEISLGLSADRGKAIVQVRDHGEGIPPGERERLFQKFARLSTAGATRGSGLGLYVSRSIVNDHGGELWADWPAGGGTVFSFSIPLIGEGDEGHVR